MGHLGADRLITQHAENGVATGTIEAFVNRTNALSNGSFTTEPTEETVKNLLPGWYRFTLDSTPTWMPEQYGVLEVIKADYYILFRFTKVNSQTAKIWQRTMNASSRVFYEPSWVTVV